MSINYFVKSSKLRQPLNPRIFSCIKNNQEFDDNNKQRHRADVVHPTKSLYPKESFVPDSNNTPDSNARIESIPDTRDDTPLPHYYSSEKQSQAFLMKRMIDNCVLLLL